MKDAFENGKLGVRNFVSPWISLETSGKEEIEVKGFSTDATRDVGKARLTLLRPDQDAA